MVLVRTFNSMTAAEFRRGIAAAGLVGECYAPRKDWPWVRETLAGLFNDTAALRESIPNPGMHAKGKGYILEFGKWPFFAMVPDAPGPQYPATGQPHVIMTRPRTVEENNFVYRLMEVCRFVLQMSDATGGRRVFPRSVSIDDVVAEKIAGGFANARREMFAEAAVHMKDGTDLFRFMRSIKGGG